jgi:hypothetical protein
VIEVFDCAQGSPEWFDCRKGIPTASEFHKLFMKGQKKGEESKTRRRYMLELIGERMTGQPRDTYSSYHMERGKEMEAEACKLYAMIEDADLQTVGFIRRDEKAGCSPDRLVGKNGLLQIKTMMPPLLLDLHLTTKPEDYTEHDCQLYGELWVAGHEREWSELFIYWPGIKPFRKRVYRDEVKIKSIELGVELFHNEMAELMQRLEAA